MTFWADVVPDLLDRSVEIDQKRTTHNPQERFPKECLHAPGAIGFDGLELGIAEEREIQLLLDLELSLGFDGIGAATQNHGSQLVEFRFCVAKLGRFGNSTGRLSFREEIQYYPLPP